jgi:fructose-bisphosphate aldolase class I
MLGYGTLDLFTNHEGRRQMDHAKMAAQMEKGEGFIAALDQSGGSTPKALKGYGLEEDAWSSDEEMFDLIHQMRSRIITSPSFSGDKVIGAILFERTMDGKIDGKPVPDVLKARHVVPFIKIDKGLEAESDGVQLMKPMPGLDALLARARELGVFGTKERSVINLANPDGIAAAVRQQFEVAGQVLAAGLVPILEPEVNIKSPERAQADRILLDELLKGLEALPGDDRVMLKLSIPATPGLFEPLVDHPRVLRVVALSGGYGRAEACAELARNRGMIASFSRALLEDLRHQMSDEEFDRSLGQAIADIHRASTEKVAA